MRRNILLVAIVFANFSALASVVASNIEPKRLYGFNYEVRKSEWLNQELQ